MHVCVYRNSRYSIPVILRQFHACMHTIIARITETFQTLMASYLPAHCAQSIRRAVHQAIIDVPRDALSV